MERDRELLTNVPTKPETANDRAKVYRHWQFLHMLRNYGEIVNLPVRHKRIQTLSKGGMPNVRFTDGQEN